MAITKCKLVRSLTNTADADGKSATRTYRLWHGTVEEAEAYIVANVVSSYTTWDGISMFIESVEVTSDDADEGVHTARIGYASLPRREPSAVGTETVSFSIASQTAKMTHSLQTINSYVASGTAPDFQQGIGYDQEGNKFEGVDRNFPLFSFSINKILANASITNAYITSLCETAFRWNAATFRGQSAGEVLFVGVAGAPRDQKTYSLNYDFLVSKNATGLTVGGISSINKLGWDHIWQLVEKMHDGTGHYLTPRPKAVYVERIYTSAAFPTTLGLAA